MTGQSRLLKKRSHEWIDSRSLDLARVIASKVREDPGLMTVVRANLERWKDTLRPWPPALEEWERILSLPLEDVLSILLEDTESGRRRRQSSPFGGILTPAERRAVFERYETIAD